MRAAAILFAAVVLAAPVAFADLLLDEDEIAMALAHGPWPAEYDPDPSNRVSGNAAAITLGEALFHDPILSVDGKFSCASCHDPEDGFTKPDARSKGRVLLPRNSPSLWNLREHRWFGWAGNSDNLWAQSMTPIVEVDEMAMSSEALQSVLISSDYAKDYAVLFGSLRDHSPEQVLVNTGKTLAAFQETLISERTPFDAFRDALEAEDWEAALSFPEDAQRGLQIFLGKGNCSVCHSGPAFTNGEFHDAGVPYFLSETEVDLGRFGGLQELLDSPFTLDGEYTDDPTKEGGWAVRQVRPTHADFGTFRTPGLRNVALTAPYMHDGSLPDLKAVIAHYNEIDLERMHADGEAILMPLGLTDQEIEDLEAFLKSLTSENESVRD